MTNKVVDKIAMKSDLIKRIASSSGLLVLFRKYALKFDESVFQKRVFTKTAAV